MCLVSSCSCLCPIYWSQVLSREWRCGRSSAERRCSNYIWVINNLIAHIGASYIRDLTVISSHWFRRWVPAYWAQNHCLNQWERVNFTMNISQQECNYILKQLCISLLSYKKKEGLSLKSGSNYCTIEIHVTFLIERSFPNTDTNLMIFCGVCIG